MKKKSNWLLLVFLSVSIIGNSLINFSIKVYAWEIDRTGTVTYIVDGDTLDVSGVGRIRLADIDCPESGEPGYSAASSYLSSLVYQKKVYIDVDDITGTDPYGRIVAVIYVYYDATRLKNVNKALLVAGHAEIWDFSNNEFNPYSWTLHVTYQSEPPPDPPPPPPPPPPDDPTPSDGNNNQLAYIGIGVGVSVGIGVSIIAIHYGLNDSRKERIRKKFRSVKDKFGRERKIKEKGIRKSGSRDIIDIIISDIITRYSPIAIYGIGSYFDETLPPNWIKNDLDIIIVVNSIEDIPKEDWDNRFKTIEINGYKLFKGYNTIESYNNREIYNEISGANYEWALIEIKNPRNSKLLYGEDIRSQMPDTTNIQFDYDDILARTLYHLDKSLEQFLTSKNIFEAITEFTKAVFKFSFYLCIYLDTSHRSTSICDIRKKIRELVEDRKIDEKIFNFLEESIYFRTKNDLHDDFKNILKKFIENLFNLLGNGKLHREMKYHELKKYLRDCFGGLSYLISILENLKRAYNNQ
ncbi:MAG: thermonuclease family protein [Candidatus Hodarchaeota archaeon]